jgi:hypothetical protein
LAYWSGHGAPWYIRWPGDGRRTGGSLCPCGACSLVVPLPVTLSFIPNKRERSLISVHACAALYLELPATSHHRGCHWDAASVVQSSGTHTSTAIHQLLLTDHVGRLTASVAKGCCLLQLAFLAFTNLAATATVLVLHSANYPACQQI